MNHKTRLFFLTISIFALAVAACRLSLPAQTESTPTATATETVPPTAAGTPTPLPTVTFTAPPPSQTSTGTPTLYPTISPIPTVTITSTITPLGANRPTTVATYACELVEKFPDQWGTVKANTPFQARWKLKNTGTLDWEPGSIVLRYVSGVEMHGDIDKREIAVQTAPNSTFIATIHMLSPKKAGDYAATWGLMERATGNLFCAFTVKIIVE